jgi:hypothetical protein
MRNQDECSIGELTKGGIGGIAPRTKNVFTGFVTMLAARQMVLRLYRRLAWKSAVLACIRQEEENEHTPTYIDTGEHRKPPLAVD